MSDNLESLIDAARQQHRNARESAAEIAATSAAILAAVRDAPDRLIFRQMAGDSEGRIDATLDAMAGDFDAAARNYREMAAALRSRHEAIRQGMRDRCRKQ